MELNWMTVRGSIVVVANTRPNAPMPSPVAVPFSGRADLTQNPVPNIKPPTSTPNRPIPIQQLCPSALESGPIRCASIHRPTSTYSQKWYQPYQWHSGDQRATCSRKRGGRAQTPEGCILVWGKPASARTAASGLARRRDLPPTIPAGHKAISLRRKSW